MELVEALAEITRESLKDFMLPVKKEYAQDDQRFRQIDIYEYGMRDPNEEPYIPYILIQQLKGEDKDNRETGRRESKALVRFVITIHEKDEVEGMRALKNIIYKIRFDLGKRTLIDDRYELKELEYVMLPDNTEKYYLGDIMTTWSVPTIQRDVQGLHTW